MCAVRFDRHSDLDALQKRLRNGSDASTDADDGEDDRQDVEIKTTQSKKLTVAQFAKYIDHYGAIREDDLTDDQIRAELEVAKEYNVRAALVRPDSMRLARAVLAGSDVRIVAVVGFPFTEDETVEVRYNQAMTAVREGADEVELIPCHYYIVLNYWPDVFWEINNIKGVVTRLGATMSVTFEDKIISNKERQEIGSLCRILDVSCVGLWPGTCEGLADETIDRKRVARHCQAIRRGLQGQIRTKVACCLYDLSDALFYIACGAHRLGTTDTSMLMDEVGYWIEKAEPLEVQIGSCMYKMLFERDESFDETTGLGLEGPL